VLGREGDPDLEVLILGYGLLSMLAHHVTWASS